ncbi:hypothetical protein CVIRNUC_008309 [Coccomyxa viridis]|uniref:Carrier domain-containing protein n=1 Tax=Coccomyxa viridis TaxID=1274662 RepID=A0AAV1ICM1_9CHLO|nr:hypothetical protein CVIRNUC_008309 [Coccomyxa viridis]
MTFDKQLEYWQKVLKGAPALTGAPTDRQRPSSVNPERYASVKQQLPAAPQSQLKGFAADGGEAAVLAAVWQVLLSRYSRSEDVVTGFASGEPAGAEVARMTGQQSNPVALRTSFADPALTFEALVPKTKEALSGALQHSGVPFPQVVDTVKAPRNQKNAPVLQALLLVREHAPQQAITSIGQLDFVLELAGSAGDRQGILHFNTDLFDKATAHRMLGHYGELLCSAASAPGAAVARLNLITPPEVTQVLRSFNAWDLPYTQLLDPEKQTIHGMFEHWAEHTPQAPALTFGDTTLSFAELDARANQLAHRLIELGAAPERPVGILMRRSLDLFTGLVAILKAGSAYVPMDPDYPPDRLAIMAGDSKAPVILSQGDLQDKVAEVLEAVKKDQSAAGAAAAALPQIVLMDAERDTIAQRPKTSPGVAMKSTNMCYIIFTSGSTGRPKGTVLQHAGVVNYFLSLVDKLKLTPADAFLQKAPISFDASVQELFNSFACGGRVVLAAPGMEKDTQALARLISSQAITNCSCVPSQLEVLLMESELDSCTALRHVLVGGEALPPVLATRFGQRLPNAHLHNAYGPTETTVDATGYDVTAEFKGGASVPIGRPINNMRCYVLDPQLQLLPVGMAGELMVSGIQLAREYLDNPEKTAASFVQNPHNHDSHPNHTRVYRTGDLARWLPTGNIEFLGRLDDQVKLRGFRIELGEVEAVLMEAPGVKLAAALVLKDASGADRLVGYVSPGAVDSEAVLAELRQRLPAHFVPSLIVPLAEMPLSPAGKVDRKKLKTDKAYVPNWQSAASAGAEEEYEAASTALEATIQRVWQEVLGQDRISVASDFFQIGGNSLRVGMVMAKVRAAINGDAPTALFFKAPTISGLAREIEALSAAAAQAKPIPAAPFTAEELALGIPCWPLQTHLLSQGAAEGTQLTAGLKFASAQDVSALEAAVNALAARHDLLRTRFARSGSSVKQVLGSGGVSVQRKDVPAGKDVTAALRAEAEIPLDPSEEGGVLRATLLEPAANGATQPVLVLTLHAVAGAEPSLTLLQSQLLAAYAGARAGSRAPIKPGLQFRDVLYWLSQRQEQGELEAQLAFWRRQLAYAPPLLSLPTDYPRQDCGESGEARGVPLVLPAGLMTQLNNVANAAGVSPFMALLAVWQLLLSAYSQTEDIIVATIVDNRKRPELADVIGPFANNVALRTSLSGLPTFKQLLSRVKGVVLSALANSELPFSQVLRALFEDQELLEETSVLQTAFNLELRADAPEDSLAECITVSRPTTQWDLEVFLQSAGKELRGELIYNADLFEESTALRIATHFKVLLEAALEAPDEVAADLSMLSADEADQLLRGFNATEAPAPADKTLSQLFEAQAAAKPQAACLLEGEHRLTYAEVDQRANQLAYHLIASGISSGATVMLLLTRSPELVVSALAALKAGCAYSALPAGLPEEALRLILQDAAPALVITHAGLQASLPKGADAPRVFNFDSAPDAEALVKRPARQLAVRGAPGDAAFIEYLPGPGNRPQGIEHTHAAIANLVLAALHKDLSAASPPVVAAHAISAASSAMLETWSALLTGGALALMPPGTGLGQLLGSAGVTAALLTGEQLESLLEDGSLEEAPALQTLLLRKEEVEDHEMLEAVSAVARHVRVCIGSGPQEAMPFAIMCTVSGDTVDAELLGRPVANTRTYVLNDRQRLLPVGVPGRLYVSGACLARGILRRPQQTAERFIANPFFDPFGDPPVFSRMVDTGILALWRPDGSLEFGGFASRQVMLRGSRIVLADVETQLLSVPGVDQAVALVQDDPTGAQRLVAYVTPASLDGAEVLQQLRRRLPAHLMPASVVALPQFPRVLMSGQVDSVSLPTPDWAAAAEEYVAPSNALEKQIQGLFQEVLGKEKVSTTANFFAEGGSQDQAADVMAKMQRVVGRGMPASLLARSPTVVGLAETLASMPAADPTAEFAIPRAPFTAAQKAAGVPCSLRQEDMARRFLEDPERKTGANESVPSSLHLRGKLNTDALESALALLVQRHEVLHARYIMRHGEVLQVIGEPPRPLLHRRAAPAGFNSALKHALVEEAAHEFDLEQDPTMMHCVLYAVHADDLVDPAVPEHVLLVVVNHVCTDGWSEKVTMTEVNAAYNAFAQTGAPPKPCPEFPDLPLSYTDFAFWQRGRVQPGGGLESQREYWAKQLKDAPYVPNIPMPSDFDRPITDDSLGEEIKVSVAADLVRSLKSLAIACGTTLFVTVLGAWKLLLSQYSGLKDVIVQTAMAGRVASELEPLIGWFANGAAVRTKLDGDDLTIKQLLDRIRRSVQGAFANSELPTGEQTVMAGLPEEDEPKLMPFGFAVHDESFFLVPEWHGLQAKRLNVVTDESEQEFGGVMLELDLLEDSGQLMGTLGYNVDLFKESTVMKIAQQFQAMLEAFVQSGPSAPTAGLPVMSELLKRMADLDEEEAEAICGLGTPVQQALPCVAEEPSSPSASGTQQRPASHALRPTASLLNPFGSIKLDEPFGADGAGEGPEMLVDVDAGAVAQALRTLRSSRASAAPGASGLARPAAGLASQRSGLASLHSGLVSRHSGMAGRQSGLANRTSGLTILKSKRSTIPAS